MSAFGTFNRVHFTGIMKNYLLLLFTGIFIGFITLSCSSDSVTYYNLSLIPTPAEGGTVTPTSGEFAKGEEVEIRATPNEDWAFERWHGDFDGNSPVATIQMDSSMVIAASFIKRDYPLTIHIEGGGQVAQEIVRSKTTDYPHGTTVELTAEPDHGWYFSHWEGDLESDENPETITVEEETSVTAVFERLDFPLTVDVEGEGTVTQEVVPAKSTDYTFETVIKLTAAAETGWKFARWEGDLEGNENPIQITIDDEKEVTAVFEENPYTLTMVIEGEGEVEQTVLPSKETVYPFGTNVSLEAFPDENWDFSHWNDNKDDTDNPTAVLVDRDITVKATFYAIPVLTTKDVTMITDSSAISGGLFSDTSDFTITSKGVCFGTSENPRLSDNCTDNGNNYDEFSSMMSDLTPDTQYYVRAYARYRDHTIYGNQVSFVTETEISVPGAPLITDVIAGDGEITVHFETPEDDGGSPVTHYEYRLNFVTGDPDVNIGLDSPFTIREGENDGEGAYEIINGEEYTVRLRAVNAAGSGPRASFDPVIPHSNGVYLHKNGVTILCPDATLGNIGTVNGIDYEVVDRAVLDQKIRDGADVTRVCTSLVTDMSKMFFEDLNFNQNIGSWDVSNVTDMNFMFGINPWDYHPERHDIIFNHDISKWDVSSVENMEGMFAGAYRFNQDIASWDVSNVKNMSNLFAYSGFNRPIGAWDVSNVTNMHAMFEGARSFDQEIEKWDVAQVEDMSNMFTGATAFNQDIGNWNVSSVTDMIAMFSEASSFNQDLSGWCVSNILSKPFSFDDGADAWELPRPIWGTCPGND